MTYQLSAIGNRRTQIANRTQKTPRSNGYAVACTYTTSNTGHTQPSVLLSFETVTFSSFNNNNIAISAELRENPFDLHAYQRIARAAASFSFHLIWRTAVVVDSYLFIFVANLLFIYFHFCFRRTWRRQVLHAATHRRVSMTTMSHACEKKTLSAWPSTLCPMCLANVVRFRERRKHCRAV